jgi:putative oxidoreductase
MEIAATVLQGLLALAFLGAGGGKVSGSQRMRDAFKKWRYPDWFRPVVGAAEVIGAIGLIVGIWAPVVAALAGLWLAVIMLGANYTHIIRIREGFYVPPAILLVLALAVVGLRFSSLTTLLA